MDLGIAGRKAIVCASSLGLGRACAMALAREGVDVVINGRHGETLARTRHEVERVATGAVTAVVGDVFDDAATGQGLLNYFLRALNCGAIDLSDVAQTGLTPDEFTLRSFAKILDARRRRLSG